MHLREEDEPIRLQTEFKFYLMILLWWGQSELPAAFIFVGFNMLGNPAPWLKSLPLLMAAVCLTFEL